MRSIISICIICVFEHIGFAQPTRKEVMNPATRADDSKLNSDSLPAVYALNGKFDRLLVLQFKYQADLLAGLESMVKQHNI